MTVPQTPLGAPITLPSGLTLQNRLMKSALSEALAGPDAGPGQRLYRLYDRWSEGGFGLVVTGNVMIDRRHLGEPGNVVIEDDRHLARLTRWAKGFQDSGTPIMVQLNHPGRQANALAGRQRPVAPSAIAARVPGSVRPRALSDAEIRDIIARFGRAAAVVKTAGFNGVQIHAAHGYLVTQFLSPLSNQRDDDWGGDPERRRRFLLEIVKEIRDRVGPGFSIGVKLNSADFQRGGFTEDESREVVRALVEHGIDLIEVSGGSYEAPAMMGTTVAASTRAREAYFLEYARTVRELAAGVPVSVTGGFRTRKAMEDALASGDCDLIGLGRGTCTTPDAGHALLTRGETSVPVRSRRVGARPVIGRIADLRQLDGVLDLQWHTDQLHRLADGKDPDPGRSSWQTLGSMIVRNGPGSLRPKRG